MCRRLLPFAAVAALFLDLAGCSNYQAQRPAWRAEAENACLAENLVRPSAYVRPVESIDGPGICGLTHPFKVAALLDGNVMLDGDYILDCPMIAALNAWVRDVVEPPPRLVTTNASSRSKPSAPIAAAYQRRIRRAAIRTCLRQCDRRARLPAAGWSQYFDRA